MRHSKPGIFGTKLPFSHLVSCFQLRFNPRAYVVRLGNYIYRGGLLRCGYMKIQKIIRPFASDTSAVRSETGGKRAPVCCKGNRDYRFKYLNFTNRTYRSLGENIEVPNYFLHQKTRFPIYRSFGTGSELLGTFF